MKLEAQRESILKPLQLVSGVVERRQTLPVLSNVLLTADAGGVTVTATDLEVELVARANLAVEEPGEITLPARKFVDICRTLPEGASLRLAVESERATLRSGRSRFSLATLPATEFPSLEPMVGTTEFSLPQRSLKSLIEHTHFAMAQQDVRYYLNGLMLEMSRGRLRGVATDGHRLALCDQALELELEDSREIIVPRKGVGELLRLLGDEDDLAQVQVGTNHIRVNLGDVTFTSKLIDGRFPDYERVVPEVSEHPVVSDRELLRQTLTRTAILSNEKFRGVRVQLSKDAVHVMAHNPEQEEAEEELEVSYSGDELEVGFNVSYLLEALNAVPAEKVQLSIKDPNSSCLIKALDSDQCRYVVMPMRL